MTEPDKYSHAYYEKQFLGVNRGLNCCLAECSEVRGLVKELHERVGKLVAVVKDDQAEMGRHKAEIAGLKERIDKASKVVQELQKGK